MRRRELITQGAAIASMMPLAHHNPVGMLLNQTNIIYLASEGRLAKEQLATAL